MLVSITHVAKPLAAEEMPARIHALRSEDASCRFNMLLCQFRMLHDSSARFMCSVDLQPWLGLIPMAAASDRTRNAPIYISGDIINIEYRIGQRRTTSYGRGDQSTKRKMSVSCGGFEEVGVTRGSFNSIFPWLSLCCGDVALYTIQFPSEIICKLTGNFPAIMFKDSDQADDFDLRQTGKLADLTAVPVCVTCGLVWRTVMSTRRHSGKCNYILSTRAGVAETNM